ncbi:MAG: hypothetical protein V4813_04920 [Gemmatimonadota bacterium]
MGAALVLSGCYAFIPTTSTTIPETTPVTVSLTLGGTVALQQVLGQNVNEVEGTVLRSTPDSLVVAVENTYTTTRQKFASSGTTASIPRPYIDQVKVRTFSRKRTVLMVVGGIAVGAGAAAAVGAGGGSGNGGGGQPPPPASVRKP